MTLEEKIKARIEQLKKERDTHPAIVEGARILAAYSAAIGELEALLLENPPTPEHQSTDLK